MRPTSIDGDPTLTLELARVRGLARRLLADPNDAEDVVQETWLKALDFARSARQAPPWGWLSAVTRRLSRDSRRAAGRRTRREERAAQGELTAAECALERGEALAALMEALHELEEPYRTTVLLRHLDARSTAEIAGLLGVSEVVVRKRLSRGLAHLRARLERRFGAEFEARFLPLALGAPTGLAFLLPVAAVAGVVALAGLGGRSSADRPDPHAVSLALPVAHASIEPRAPSAPGNREVAAEHSGSRVPLVPSDAPARLEPKGKRFYGYESDGQGHEREVEIELAPDAKRSD